MKTDKFSDPPHFPITAGPTHCYFDPEGDASVRLIRYATRRWNYLHPTLPQWRSPDPFCSDPQDRCLDFFWRSGPPVDWSTRDPEGPLPSTNEGILDRLFF